MEGVVDIFLSVETGPRATATQKAFIRSLLLTQSPAGYSSLCSTITNAQTPRYVEATCPLLVIAGSDDNTAPMAGSQAILDRCVYIPQSTPHMLDPFSNLRTYPAGESRRSSSACRCFRELAIGTASRQRTRSKLWLMNLPMA